MENTIYIISVVLLILQIRQHLQINNLKINNAALWISLTLLANNIGKELDKIKPKKEEINGEQTKKDN